MADHATTLDVLQAFDRILLAVLEGRHDVFEQIDEFMTETLEEELDKLWTRPPRNEADRNTIKSGMSPTPVVILSMPACYLVLSLNLGFHRQGHCEGSRVFSQPGLPAKRP
jgi:hypothetical protein